MSEINPEPLNIAIIGAGIAGLSAAVSLLKLNNPLIKITIYERASQLREIGASIALGPNGLRTLERLGLGEEIEKVAFRGPTKKAGMVYRHWETNEIIGMDEFIGVREDRHCTARFLRAHLQEVLLKAVPTDIVILGRKLASIQLTDHNTVKLLFQNGITEEADLVVAADGIHSAVRRSFFPEFEPKWSGSTAFRTVFDAKLVDSIPDLPEDSTHWWGPENNFFSSRLGRDTFTVVGIIYDDPQNPAARAKGLVWDEETGANLFRETFKDWNPVVKALTELTPSIRAFPNHSSTSILPTWVFGDRITLLGDAAHAHGGAYATGGSLAIDDAYTFSLALSSVFPSSAKNKPPAEEIGKALKLYEKVRKPHAERLVKMVHAANERKLQQARSGKVETDMELRARAAKGSSTEWLHEHDAVEAFSQALGVDSTS